MAAFYQCASMSFGYYDEINEKKLAEEQLGHINIEKPASKNNEGDEDITDSSSECTDGNESEEETDDDSTDDEGTSDEDVDERGDSNVEEAMVVDEYEEICGTGTQHAIDSELIKELFGKSILCDQ